MSAKKIRQFVFRLLLLLALVVIVAVVLIEKGMVGGTILRIAGDAIGIQMTAERFRIGMDGKIRINGFTAAFADESEPFFTADKILILCSSLPDLLTSGQADVTEIRVGSPTLVLNWNDEGQLNLSRLFSHRSQQAGQSDTPFTYTIPAVTLVNGTLIVRKAGQTNATVSPIQFKSLPVTNGIVRSVLKFPGDNTLTSRIELKSLNHQLKLDLKDCSALPYLAESSTFFSLKTQLDWQGRVLSKQPFQAEGDLSVEHLSVLNAEGSAQAGIVVDSDHITAEIHRLQFDPGLLLSGLERCPEPIAMTDGTLSATFRDRRITAQGLDISVLQGQVRLDAVLFPQRWLDSKVVVEFQNLHPSVLLSHKLLEDAALSGVLDIEPATDRRPMEPMSVSLQTRIDGPVFAAAGLENVSLNAYLGPERFVTQELHIPICDGFIRPWVSLTRRDRRWFTHVIADLENININRLAKAFTGQARSVPGVLNGDVRFRTFGGLSSLSGDAELALTQSDLMQTDIIGAVYSAMNLSFGNPSPTGNGRFKLSMQGERIDIMSFDYFNRGVEIRGAGKVEQISQGKAAPLEGFVTGSLRPLRDNRLPGTAQLDKLISGMQSDLATLKIGGTLGDPETHVVPMSDIQNALRALLMLQLQQ